MFSITRRWMLAVMALAVPAFAQCREWAPGEGLPGVNSGGEVHALAVWDDGSGPALYAAGNFSAAGSTLASGIARWDGAAWRPLGEGLVDESSSEGASVRALAVHQNRLIAAGKFTRAGSAYAANIAAWDGAAWRALGDGIPLEPSSEGVLALSVFEGELVAGGDFSALNHLARFDGSAWHPLGGGRELPVRALAIYGGRLAVGGDFSLKVAGFDGTAWRRLAIGMGLNDSVHALAVHEGRLIAGGSFRRVGGVMVNNIAAYDGAAWSALGAGATPWQSTAVLTLLSTAEGLVAGGRFQNIGGTAAVNIARFDGSAWHPLGGGLYGATLPSGSARALAFFDGCVIAGGVSIVHAGAVPANGLARFDGSLWSPLGVGTSSDVYTLGIYSGEIVAGGRFETIGGVRASRLALGDGSRWRDVGGGLDGLAYATTTFRGDLIVGGNFKHAGGVSARNIARWDGAAWRPLAGGIDGVVFALAEFRGELYAGGYFLEAGGVAARNIARFDGSAWRAVTTGVSSQTTLEEVRCLLVRGDHLIVGGAFDTAGGEAAFNVASWSGNTWQAVGTRPWSWPADVIKLAEHNGELLAVGAFDSAGGSAAGNIARFDGSAWGPLGSGVNGYAACAQVVDGRLYVGGYFDTAGEEPARSLAVWDGAVWRDAHGGVNAGVLALLPFGGRLYAGGSFTSASSAAGEVFSAYLARLTPACPADMDGDCVADFTDYLVFLNSFEALEPAADLDGDGVIDFTDLLRFLEAYEAGCP